MEAASMVSLLSTLGRVSPRQRYCVLPIKDKMQLDGLKVACEAYLRDGFTADAVAGIWLLARETNAASLQAQAFKYMLEHFDTVQSTSDFAAACLKDQKLTPADLPLIAVVLDTKFWSLCNRRCACLEEYQRRSLSRVTGHKQSILIKML
jgi:hypothetical protein